MKRVVIESPYAGSHGSDCVCTSCKMEVLRNIDYLRACMADCFARGEAPYASHALYTQPGVLRDHDKDERKLGIEAGFEWGDLAKLRVVYSDLGVSNGMNLGIERARRINQPVEYRLLPGWKNGNGA